MRSISTVAAWTLRQRPLNSRKRHNSQLHIAPLNNADAECTASATQVNSVYRRKGELDILNESQSLNPYIDDAARFSVPPACEDGCVLAALPRYGHHSVAPDPIEVLKSHDSERCPRAVLSPAKRGAAPCCGSWDLVGQEATRRKFVQFAGAVLPWKSFT